jgi:cellulose synthase/poly-beta-1,6-N-acetylglucosamine synthase-like glycosyltransferase
MKLSIIVPAHNEEKLLPETLRCIVAAMDHFGDGAELIVVDNMSTDTTAQIAGEAGAKVIEEQVRNIGAVRNAGAAAAAGDVLVFIDADTLVPETLFSNLAEVMQDLQCVGGSVAVKYGKFERWWMNQYAKGWAFWGNIFNMRQGAAQFCRRLVFEAIGGYDDTVYLGEDIEFYWELERHARETGCRVEFIREPKVLTSTRRFDRMSLFKTLVLTHPVYILINRKRAEAWKDWYDKAVR